MPFGLSQTGGPNEPWSYGDEAYEHIKAALFLRERLRPYVMTLMRAVHSDGIPAMRPLFVDFPSGEVAWSVEDAYMFGLDLLAAPVADYGTRGRLVYLPDGGRWTNAWTGATHDGGAAVRVAASLGQIPLFLRDGASLPIFADG
jgi:alpha-D-xyloside xylohydrolase